MNYKQIIQSFVAEMNYPPIVLKSVFFDMDGVLYDSMPNHAKAWHETMKLHGLNHTYEDAYIYEGRTGASTIQLICDRDNIVITDDEVKVIYEEKTEAFNKLPSPKPIIGSYELLQEIMYEGLSPVIVTGSGQAALLDSLNKDFPGIFQRERMVTGFDVIHGKPHPEPYLMALEKAKIHPWEAFVVENAPLGVKSARAAGLFVIAVNTGPLPDKCLIDAGANLLFTNMITLGKVWDAIRNAAQN